MPLEAILTTKFLLAAGTTAAVAGAGMQYYGARQAAKSESALYRYNQQLLNQEAQQRRTASLEEQQIQREQMRRVLKRQRAIFAKRGLQMRGSPLEVQLETVEVMSADIAQFAYGRELEATGLEARARVEKYKIGAVKRAGRLSMAASLVGGVSDLSRLGIQRHLLKQQGLL